MVNQAALITYRLLYESLARPIIFLQSAQQAHERLMRLLRWVDEQPRLLNLLDRIHARLHMDQPTTAGGVMLPGPLILAAGMVKGDGFKSESDAIRAAIRGQNIVPGWQAIPRLVGPVEFGSYTRWPRMGNPGVVMWRDPASRTTQNRVGLKNPGAEAAARFFSSRTGALPPQFGINIAVSPGVIDPAQEQQEVLESIAAFVNSRVIPAWFTLNLSCPNTEDDPGAHQTAEKTRALCSAVVDYLDRSANAAGQPVPLWVKVGPTLAAEQYRILMQVFDEVGVRAVIATNTLPEPAPGAPDVQAGVGGGKMHRQAVAAAEILMQEKRLHGYEVDVIGCGGVLDGASYADFARLGVTAMQYWTALVYRGPLAAAVIAHESHSGKG